MKRESYQHEGLTFSYLDSGGSGPILVALHAHMMTASTFESLAVALAPDWRVIALDQRGHGHSDHATSYTRDGYIGDIEALFAHLKLSQAAILGNSLGGPNAYQFAARHPTKVRALIIEDIGVVINDDTSFMLPWRGTFPSREALAERIGARMVPYVQESIVQTNAGWQLAFDPDDMMVSQKCLNGDYWTDWLATDCPALLIRGRDSKVTTQMHLEEMARRRPNTRLLTVDGGHVLHVEKPEAFNSAVREFLMDDA